jgi:hypothetical protein
MGQYKVIDIPLDAREDTEQLGSKPKFWVLLGAARWLFKEARPNTGEDWAEKVASELAKVLGISAATVELAEYAGKRGCISLNFVDVEAGEALVHGNEILAFEVTGYDKQKKFRQSDHTLENLQAAVRRIFGRDKAIGILTQLASYIVLDALIGNTDRHHENWGLKVRPNTNPRRLQLEVAPSFDHASSLGRELLDPRRADLINADKVGWYVAKGRGGIFRDAEQPHGENPLKLVQSAARAYPAIFQDSIEKVAALDPQVVRRILAAIPEDRASVLAKQFAEAMILKAQTSLTEILR